jgi:hypothetical protein
MIFEVEVWLRPWSAKARTQEVQRWAVEAASMTEAESRLRETLRGFTLKTLDQIVVVGEIKFPLHLPHHGTKPKRPGVEHMGPPQFSGKL